jgi:voltage-gated potassium channel
MVILPRADSPISHGCVSSLVSSYILVGALQGCRESSVSGVGAVFGSMLFLRQACAAIVLVFITLGMQSAGMAGLIGWAKSHFARGAQALGAWSTAALVVRFTSLIICLHILEILLWTAFYRRRCLSTWESAFYFSATSYSTVGYGDVVLQPVWRLLGPVESVSCVLMCGLSARISIGFLSGASRR